MRPEERIPPDDLDGVLRQLVDTKSRTEWGEGGSSRRNAIYTTGFRKRDHWWNITKPSLRAEVQPGTVNRGNDMFGIEGSPLAVTQEDSASEGWRFDDAETTILNAAGRGEEMDNDKQISMRNPAAPGNPGELVDIKFTIVEKDCMGIL